MCFRHHFNVKGGRGTTLLVVYKSVTEADLCDGGGGFRMTRLQIVLRSYRDVMLKHSGLSCLSHKLPHVSVLNMKSGGTVFTQPRPLQHFFSLLVGTNNNKQRKTLSGMKGKTERIQILLQLFLFLHNLLFWLLLGLQILFLLSIIFQ